MPSSLDRFPPSRSSYSYALFIHTGRDSSSLSSSTSINRSAASLALGHSCLHLIRNNSLSNKALQIKVKANIFTPTQYLIPFLVTNFCGHSGYPPNTVMPLTDSCDHFARNRVQSRLVRVRPFQFLLKSSLTAMYSRGVRYNLFFVGIISSCGFQYCLISIHALPSAMVQ